jgi:hypothetical protein
LSLNLLNKGFLNNEKSDNDILFHLLGQSKELDPSLIIPAVRTERVLKGMGMKLTDADPYLLNLIGEFISQAEEIFSPRAGYILDDKLNFDFIFFKTIVSGTELNTGKIVNSLLKRSKAIVLFSCTCGHEIEKLSKEFMKNGHGLEGFIVDLIGSELAESVAEYLHDYIETNLSGIGYGVTNRFSPGYCNWPVSDQYKLFSLLKENNCGIELTPSSLMLPVKSVSGIIGIGPEVKRADYKCRICHDENCIMREES